MRKQYFRDALLSESHILPAGASLTTVTDGIDLGLSEQAGSLSLKAQLLIEAPALTTTCLLYTSPSPRDRQKSRMPSSA